MTDYEPLDISSSFNAGFDALGEVDPVPEGIVSFHGLPFQMGDGVIALDESRQSVRIAVGRRARSVVFAHSLGAAELTEVEPVGQAVADYLFHMADGRTIRGADQGQVRDRIAARGRRHEQERLIRAPGSAIQGRHRPERLPDGQVPRLLVGDGTTSDGVGAGPGEVELSLVLVEPRARYGH